MKKLIVVSDCANDSLSRQEVQTAVEGFLNDPSSPNITFVNSTPSTIHTSFLIAQLIEVEERFGRPLETVFFQNTDPRIQSDIAVKASQGAKFVVARLASGIFVCGPNAGYNFTLFKDKIEEFYEYQDLDKGSQFRSRDLYPRVGAHLMDALEDDLDLEEISTNEIPELEGFYVGHIDNFGNIKTTIPEEYLHGKAEYGDMVELTINGVTKQAKYVDNLFGGEPGMLVIYPGSSGPVGNPYLEITVWRHFTEKEQTTGVHAFNTPLPGTKIEVQVKK